MSEARRIQLQPAYVLHHRPYRDSSRILELFTRDYGRLTLFARGARSGRAGARSLISLLQPFNRLLLTYSERGEAGQLNDAEFDGAMVVLPAARLVHGFYLNELLLKLLARHDAHTDVFVIYEQALAALKQPDELPALAGLRVFEKRLLDALGYGLALEHDAVNGRPIDPDGHYHYRLEQGAVRASTDADITALYPGEMLLALANEQLEDAASCVAARRLLRGALDRVLDGRELRSRQVMLALRKGK